MEQYLRVGVISSTHGIRGEVKVFPTTDDPERFLDLEKVYMETPKKERIELVISGVKFFKQYVILKFKGIDNINDIEHYKGCELYVSREDAVPLEEDEFYIADLLGMKVVLDSGTEFGTLKDVMETGANDVYIIDTKEHGEVLIPAIPECVQDIDVEAGLMTIHLMKGLI